MVPQPWGVVPRRDRAAYPAPAPSQSVEKKKGKKKGKTEGPVAARLPAHQSTSTLPQKRKGYGAPQAPGWIRFSQLRVV